MAKKKQKPVSGKNNLHQINFRANAYYLRDGRRKKPLKLLTVGAVTKALVENKCIIKPRVNSQSRKAKKGQVK